MFLQYIHLDGFKHAIISTLVVRIGNRNFSPGLLPTLATALILPALLALGFWQLDRADQKRTMLADILQRQAAEPLKLNKHKETMQVDHEILWHRVVANGQFDEDVQILLDNQVLHGRAGYFVYTPYQLAGDNSWFLVNRGWVPAGDDRTRIPALHRTSGQVLILGSLKKVPKTGLMLKDATSEQMYQGVYRLQEINPEKIETMINRKLEHLIIRLEPDSDYGYIRDWPAPNSGIATHLGYAFQWFALAITLVIIYIVVNLKKIDETRQL